MNLIRRRVIKKPSPSIVPRIKTRIHYNGRLNCNVLLLKKTVNLPPLAVECAIHSTEDFTIAGGYHSRIKSVYCYKSSWIYLVRNDLSEGLFLSHNRLTVNEPCVWSELQKTQHAEICADEHSSGWPFRLSFL